MKEAADAPPRGITTTETGKSELRARVSEAARTAFRGGKGAFLPLRHDNGLKDQLGHALAASDTSALRRGIEQHDDDFPGIIGVDDAHALSNHKAVARAEPAAGVEETGNPRQLGLHSQTGRHRQTFSGKNLPGIFIKTGAQIRTNGMGGRRGQAVRVQGAGLRADEFHAHGHH